MDPLLQPAKVLESTPFLLSTNHTTQPGGICKLAECALETSACVIDENIKTLVPLWIPEGHITLISEHSSLISAGKDFTG